MTRPSFRDVESLNAYLDGQLEPASRQQLEARLQSDPDLKATMDALRESRTVLRRLPPRRAPRNFTLTPKMAGIKPPLPRAYPVFRLASLVAAFLFFFAYATNFLPRLSMSMNAAAPAAVGVGGAPEDNAQRSKSGGGCDNCTPEATLQALAPVAPAEGTLPSPEATSAPIPATAQPLVQQAPAAVAPAPEAPRVPVSFPSPTGGQIVLLVIASLAGGVALLIRFGAERRWVKAHAGPGRITWRNVLLIALAILLIALAVGGVIALASGGY